VPKKESLLYQKPGGKRWRAAACRETKTESVRRFLGKNLILHRRAAEGLGGIKATIEIPACRKRRELNKEVTTMNAGQGNYAEACGQKSKKK